MRRSITSNGIFRRVLAAAAVLLGGQMAMAQYVPTTAVNGTGGDGGEGFAKLVDRDATTKWGQSFDPANPERAEAWLVIKAEAPVVPGNFFVVTGNDTGAFPERNWKDWNIYGGNFASDVEAQKGAAGWTLINESRSEVLPAQNFAPSNFMFNKADGTTAYQYYLIEITAAVSSADVYLQMSEFGLGTYEEFIEFLNTGTADDEPIGYRIIDGTRNNTDGESLRSLFDGNNFTKWGNGINGDNEDGAYAIFRTSRKVVPTYYKLTTGTDNASWGDRNWRNWCIYGSTETDESKITRDADSWVLLDERIDVGEDVLPDYNSYEVYFNFNQENTTPYQYFKIEIRDIQSHSGYMQMSEFALGDAAQFELDKLAYLADGASRINAEKPFQKSLMNELLAIQARITNATEPAQLGEVYNEFGALVERVNNSIRAYEDYITIVETIKNHFDNHECITGEGRTLIGNYLGAEVAPGTEFPNGSYPYILKELALDNEQVRQEGIFAATLLENNATDLTDGAIGDDVKFEVLAGTETNSAEGPGALFDYNQDTKWCTTNNPSVYVIFAASEPVMISYYKLTTANDTGNNPGRNWKNWKVYGANFDSEEAALDRNAEAWTLIDQKSGVASSQLPAANFESAYFYMSSPGLTPYQYYRIEVESFVDGATQQMSGIEFGNDANRILLRNAAAEEFAAYDLDVVAQKSLIEEYKQQLQALQTCASVIDLGDYVASLTNLRNQLDENVVAYEDYAMAVSLLDPSAFADYEQASAWAEGYLDEVEGPGTKYMRGSHQYIMENLSCSTTELRDEIDFINNMIRAIDEESLICLSGKGAGWGMQENWAKLIDGNLETKWGGPIEQGGNYVIFRTLGESNPFFYTLNTGGDTETYPNRNWGSWQIYGANFDGDGDAVVDALEWELIDDKQNVGQDRLHPTNTTASYFGLSSETAEKYMYYKVVVTKAYTENSVQMQELIFGTEEEFEIIKNGYKEVANEFDYDRITAEQRLLDNYADAVGAIDDCINMEVLFRINYGLEQMRDSINASAAVYARYKAAVDDAAIFLQQYPLDESAALTIFSDYVNGADEPTDQYPNGQAQYVLEEHLLPDSLIEKEMVFMEALKSAAVSAGYVAGTDITSMIVNPRFANGNEGWDAPIFGSETNAERTMSAAEMVREMQTYDVSQTLTGMKNGYYLVKLNAAFRPGADDIYSYNYAAMAYANDMQTWVPTTREDMVPKDEAVNRQNCWLEGEIADHPIEIIDDMSGEVTDTLGYVAWGIQSCCYAFSVGRYEVALIAQVTDGTLRFGVKNEGTVVGGDWTGFGNFRLTYLGEEPTAEALAEAAAYNAARIATLTSVYEPADTEAPEYANYPGYATAQKEALLALSGKAEYSALQEAAALFEAVNNAKKAYVALNNAKNLVYDKWLPEVGLNPDLSYNMEFDIYEVMEGLNLGTYATIEAANEAKAALYAKYPDYLSIDELRAPSNVAVTRTDAFTYDLATDGVRPNIALSGFYEDIDASRCILAIDYKAAQPIADGAFYFATPTLTNTQVYQAGELQTAGEWKTMYWDVTGAITEWGFGKADSWIRWDISLSGAEALQLSIRKPRLITQAEMTAEGGTINAISDVKAGTPTAAQGIFRLNGVRVEKAEKGLYIIDGRKTLVK